MKKITINVPDQLYDKVSRMSDMHLLSKQKYCRRAVEIYANYDEKKTLEWLEKLAQEGKDEKKKQETEKDSGSVPADDPAV